MDLEVLLPIVKKVSALLYRKRVLLPLSFIWLVWRIFLKPTSRRQLKKKDLKIRKPIEEICCSGDQIVEYNLKNFVSFPAVYPDLI